ncbi:MAG: hypothetical protein HN403_03855 [Rhodospirillales bacterium]|jgi:hypothetical protein|nr:hypothetical protein [Rhodospirillales bacterium]
MNDEPKVDDLQEDADPGAEDGFTASKKPGKLARNLVISCVGTLVAALSVWLVIAAPELMKRFGPPPPPPLTAEQQIELKAKEAERTASWQNYHCNLFHHYYDGTESEAPMSEILGLGVGADQKAIGERCKELLPVVRSLGGWPTGRPQQDNIVVCEGFRFLLKGGLPLEIRPRREGLAHSVVHFRLGGDRYETQKVQVGQPTTVGPFTPLVVQADEQCVVVAVSRVGRKAAVAGRVVRVKETTPETAHYNTVQWYGGRPAVPN